jgi:hypothetical protein
MKREEGEEEDILLQWSLARDRAINNNYPGWLHARSPNPTTRGGSL